MKKRFHFPNKFQNLKKYRHIAAGTLCLVLAAVLLWSQLGGILQAEASEKIYYDGTDAIWKAGSAKVTSMNGELTESVKVSDYTLYTNGTSKKPTVDTAGGANPRISDAYVEDAELSLELQAGAQNQVTSYALSLNNRRLTTAGMVCTEAENGTYYVLVTDSSAPDSFKDFKKEVKDIYQAGLAADSTVTVSTQMLMTTENQGGLAFNRAIQSYMQTKGAQLYKSGDRIPLYTAEGRPVVRIDMLSVSQLDFALKGKYVGFFTFRADYDAVVSASHSYALRNTAPTAESPTAVLESGTALNGSGTVTISPDDRVKTISSRSVDSMTAGTWQYVLSDEQITDFSTITWKVWDKKTPVDLEKKKYLYLRVIPRNDSGTLLYLTSDPAEYVLSYLTEEPQAATASASGDQVTLTTAQKDGRIFYTTDKTDIIFTKVTGTTLSDNLNSQAASYDGGLLTYSEKKYLRVNGLWYQCSAPTEYYRAGTALDLPYNNKLCAELRTKVVAEGYLPQQESTVHRYQKLNTPSAVLESGGSPGSNTDPADRIVRVRVTNPYASSNAYHEPYGKAVAKAAVQTYFSETRIENPDSITGWENLSKLPADLPEKDGYYYLRLKASDEAVGGFTGTYLDSAVQEYRISYLTETWPEDALTITVIPGTAVTEEGKNGTGTFELKVPEDIRNTVLLYSLTEDITPERVDDGDIRTALNGAVSGRTAVQTEYQNRRYARANGIWYDCGPASAVLAYTGEVQLDDSKALAAGMTIRVMMMADNYTGSVKKEKTVQSLDAPEITLESGKAAETDKISQDDRILSLDTHYGSGTDLYKSCQGLELQYYLTDRNTSAVSEGLWKTWDGKMVGVNRNAYLYVRAVAPQDSGYLSSAPRKVKLSYLTEEPGGIEAKAYVDGKEVEGGVDFGDQIELIELKAVEGNQALIFYTTDGSQPTFTRPELTTSQKDELESRLSGVMGSVSWDGKVYVKVNGLWYECGAQTILYNSTTRIQVDESIYAENYLVINALGIVEGKTIGTADRFSYAFYLREQVKTPTASVADGETVQIGDLVNLLGDGENIRIYYTTNGSAPVVELVDGKITLGEGTKEFSGTPIQISTDFAEYGSTVTITAVACKFRLYGEDYARVMRDSELARFTYKVGAQAAVEPVTSVPATDADNRTVVKPGSKIRLYSGTEKAVIFYTLDGSEPAFNETTLEPSSGTLKYNSSEAITVPPITDSSVITITAVAWCEGLASSNISRLIFQYPGAVSAPYATPAAGAVTENTQVTLKTATEGAVIYYTTDGTDPTEKSNVYDSSNPFVITKDTTIKALAIKDKMESEIMTFTYRVSTKLSVPTASIDSGSVVASGTVVGLTADSGATIRYTVDGSDPKKSGNQKVLIGSSVIISGSPGDVITVRTYASKSGFSDSEVGYYSYSISGYEGGIFADRETGSTVKNGDVIRLNTDVSNAKIYYTTDGSTPTESSHAGSSVTIQGNPGEKITVKAIAVASGTNKAVSAATFVYTILDKLAAPTASVPTGAVFTKKSAVELTAETGSIYYTTDGSVPTTASSLYKDGIVISSAVTVKAIAVADKYEQSDVSTFTYDFANQVEAPQTSYASGELDMGTVVEFTCGTEGASIYYRTDGADPDLKDTSGLELYTGPITINKAVTFKILAVKNEMQDSKVVTVGYTVREPVLNENQEEETGLIQEDGSGRLKSRRSFSDTQSGPSYTGTVLRNAVYGIVVAAEENVLPENVQLDVKQVQTSDAAERMVKQLVSESYGIVESYDVTLLVNGEAVQPEGTIEIGLPIPASCENSLIQVAYVTEDGSVELYDTRRSGGTAYIKTSHLSVYAITAPTEFPEETADFPWMLVGYGGAVALTALGIWLLYRAGKKKREGGKTDE